MFFRFHRGNFGVAGSGRRRAFASLPEPFILNLDAMLAILPNPAAAEIVFHALNGRNWVMSFASAGDDRVVMSLLQRGHDHEVVPLFETRMSKADGRLLWRRFCDRMIPLPGVLAVEAPAGRRSGLSSMLLLGVGLALGGVIGWGVAGGAWSAIQRMAVVLDGSALPATNEPAVAAVAAPVASGTGPALPPVSSSPALEAGRGGHDQSAVISEPGNAPSVLLALRELRLALQDGRPVSPDLFRRLPADVQRLLVAEGLVEAGPETPSSGFSVTEPVRLPTGAVLRAGSDPHGVPLVPRRLPSGFGEGALPPVGGGDLHRPQDFEAFGLRPPGN